MYDDNEIKYTEGKVILSTKEYRDLIEDNMKKKAEYDRQNSLYWDERNKTSKLQEKIDKLTANLKQYEGFIAENKLGEAYSIFLIRLQNEQKEEN